MMRRRIVRTVIAGGALSALALGGATLASPAAASHEANNLMHGHLHPLNNSGTMGKASVRIGTTHLNAMVNVTGAAPNLPHAQHIHFGQQARHECPIAADAGGDFRINTVEGQPAYGPIAVSLTTRGNTSDASALAVDRMPTANGSGNYFYYRTGIRVVASATETAADIAQGIRMGQGVVVVHGIDYNGNGQYDFASAGASELNPDLPAEATDPIACGVLR